MYNNWYGKIDMHFMYRRVHGLELSRGPSLDSHNFIPHCSTLWYFSEGPLHLQDKALLGLCGIQMWSTTLLFYMESVNLLNFWSRTVRSKAYFCPSMSFWGSYFSHYSLDLSSYSSSALVNAVLFEVSSWFIK